MKIAVPTYNRPTVFKQKTLSYLLSEGIQPEEIDVFLKNEEQLVLYKQHITENLNWVVCNTQNLCEKRQFICDYYPEGEHVVSIDDDIKRLKMLRPVSLRILLKRMFEEMVKQNCKVWGFYPVSNLFFCKDKLRVGKQFIIFSFYGFLNTKDFSFPNLIKEDIWYSCFRSQEDGAVLRYNGACMDTTFYAKGGLSEYRNIENETEACRQICDQYSDLVSFTIKKDEHPYCKWKRLPHVDYDLIY